MEAGQIWGITGTVIGAVAVVVTIVVGRLTYVRQFPKRRIGFQLDSTALVSKSVPLDIAFAGRSLADPQVLEVTIVSNSRADIPSTAFDSSRSVRIDLCVGIVTVLANQQSGVAVTVEGNDLVIAPQLIRAGAFADLSLLVDGAPVNVSVTNPLTDVEIRNLSDYAAPTSGAQWRDGISIFGGIFFLSLMAGVLVTCSITPVIAIFSVTLPRLLAALAHS